MNRRSFFATLAAVPAAAWAAVRPKALTVNELRAAVDMPPEAHGRIEWPALRVIPPLNWEPRLQTWARMQPGYDGRLNTHEWDYGYSRDCGVPGPYPHDIGQGDGNTRITLAEYRAAMTGQIRS